MLNIVIVEDNEDLRETLISMLSEVGHRVTGQDSAESFWRDTVIAEVDLAILDLNLPGEDGLSLSRRLRQLKPEVGIIMLTARSELHQRLAGYEGGADIYITKPGSVPELIAAVDALSRRLRGGRAVPGKLSLDARAMELRGPAGQVSLSASETDMLALLASSPQGRADTPSITALFGEAPLSKAALEVKMVRLRKKLAEASGQDRTLEAVRNFGYQLCVPIELQ
ncbi:MAG: hypothetical protein RIT14_586 [Pseudomonadota bacterium]|jgi:DNA-binding response OmpR family regulator